MADLSHLIYSSTPFGYAASDLNGILATARRCNPALDITGALICRQDVYLQYLEGPEDALTGLYDKIKRDDRHVDVILRAKGAMDQRLFADWAMLHDPSDSLIWTMHEVDQGLMDDASPLEYLTTFQTIAAKSRAA
ncbi:BLUF domain-containing protein [Jannaschia sp. CCS1]|uniref:BLUF domain-containing protein n=1 Tax=Jannaschia sp. (strain CCS1) TaxID=290400 RepID=UPI000053B5C7|nr:BLUF domain-containing protein [Jannaschia sp. CCS1]ABD56238.1 BLUF [Jannaschia sp. CCS1]